MNTVNYKSVLFSQCSFIIYCDKIEIGTRRYRLSTPLPSTAISFRPIWSKIFLLSHMNSDLGWSMQKILI